METFTVTITDEELVAKASTLGVDQTVLDDVVLDLPGPPKGEAPKPNGKRIRVR